MIWGWRRSKYYQLRNGYCTPDITRIIQAQCLMGQRVSTFGWMTNACIILFVKPERKAHLKGPRPKWEDNIQTDLKNRVVNFVLDSYGS